MLRSGATGYYHAGYGLTANTTGCFMSTSAKTVPALGRMCTADAVAKRDGLLIQQLPEQFQRWRDATRRVVVRGKVVFLGFVPGKG